MIRIGLLLTSLALLSACTQVASRAASAVNHYCIEPLETRLLIRAQVAAAIEPNRIYITCAGDPPGTEPE
jgi:hypothetical protein